MINSTDPRGAFQQLGAVPRETQPHSRGCEGHEPETYDTENFDAELAERDGPMNYVGAMGYEAMNYVDGYGTGFTERENAGDEEGAPTAGASTVVCDPASSPWEAQRHRTEEAKDGSKQQSPFGSTPATRPYPTATSAQTPGHFCSNPAERVKGEAPLTRDF